MILHLFREFSQKIKEQEPLSWLVKVTVWFLSLFIVYILGFFLVEDVSFEEAFWQGWQTFTTVGYGNRPAETSIGRWLTIVLCTLGIAILGALFSAAFDYRQHLINKKRLGLMINPFKDGYVIFNFPGEYQLINFIKELRSVENDVGICIVDSRLEELPQSISVLPKIHFVRGNTLSKETYERAEICDNKSVIIFPTVANVPDSDGATKTIIDLVSRFIGEGNTRILHLLVDPSNSWMFDNVKSTQIMESFELLALVQECQDIYSAEIVEKLLLNSKGANPKTCKPNKIVGMTWGGFLKKSIEFSESTGTNCNPFALIRGGQPDTCPKLSEIIQKDDFISIIAHHNFDWAAFENEVTAD
ncbi:potassium channel family protein [Flammeovirgaceae bacterium SG7u.111]|nr:potassium channel family protein [Flammeovirgaceae bacterium SG7u.132]WPO37468.1 potassium channel family protein [Flammeovirgaceae bacterium SG7u.111]